MSRLVIAVLVLVGTVASAAPAAPTGAHPRIVLDDTLRATWKAQAKHEGSAAAVAIARCTDASTNLDARHDNYMGLDWSQTLQACLVAYAATGSKDHARTAIAFFKALLDDLDDVGDGKGGDEAARRDSGFAMRALGPSTALAYDWLYDLIPEPVRAHARDRWAAWVAWYADNGYRAHSPGTNYHAGWVIAATLIAIAEGDDDTELWTKVVDEMWGQELAAALAPGGLLDGGDWPEGWEYGPLAVAEYALAARALAGVGVTIPGVDRWLASVARFDLHATSPAGTFFAGGDAQDVPAQLPPPYLAYAAPLIGDAPAATWALARWELGAYQPPLDQPLYTALAEARDVKPVAPTDEPTAYLSPGAGVFFARSRWGKDAAWMATQCAHGLDIDHAHADAGNVILSRGADDVLVDPSPYGTQSTLTSNAPTVDSGHFPGDYRPSQALWSVATRFVWTRQTASGVAAVRCDYADQYKFQDRDSDVPAAVRDIVMIPSGKEDATLVVIDRARSGDAGRDLYLRFRTGGLLTLTGDVASGRAGSATVTIQRIASSSGTPSVRAVPVSSCFDEGVIPGKCDGARVPVGEYALQVKGPEMSALHVIDAAGGPVSAATPLDGVDGVLLERGGRRAVVVAGTGAALHYRAPKGDQTIHVVLGAGALSATADGDTCVVDAAAGAALQIVQLDAACAVHADAAIADAASPAAPPRAPRSGCCGASAAPGRGSIALAVIVLLALFRERSGSRRCRRA